MIDVIIPAYNVDDATLFKCLASLSMQTMRHQLKITIVDDASTTENYQEVANHFASMLDITILRCLINGGPGVARQCGIDNTSGEVIMFVDADDVLSDIFSVETMYTRIQYPKTVISVCSFLELIDAEYYNKYKGTNVIEPQIVPHHFDGVWMFGKMYRRAFLEKYNIHFHPTCRANEDSAFNQLTRLYLNDSEQMVQDDKVVYYWLFNPNSITRQNDCEYTYGSGMNHSLGGFIEGYTYSIQHYANSPYFDKYNPAFIHSIAEIMVLMYYQYVLNEYYAPQTADANLAHHKKLYKFAYAPYADIISKQELEMAFSFITQDYYHKEELMGIIPSISFFGYLDKIKEEEDNESK